ncbi:hypothetical protein PAERUG_E15_London_28_01_14_01335 [Pseudomonas aeruginosa]|nr:DUF421 domain-containing protein [Stenotrophomonas maltophilia]CRP92739.1 hypothetical protein PAERUG_E15_London_28_01_14_01335 [Pseudomonas aeruginosa]
MGHCPAGEDHARPVRAGHAVVGIHPARGGRLFEAVFRRELISRADFDAALRQQGGLQIEDVQIALLETTGHITIIARKGS